MKKCWIINSAFIAYSDTLSASIRRNLNETDLSNYRELLGTVVWYTSSSTGSEGPDRLPDLPWPIAFAFDSMTTGDGIEIDGVFYTLDSLVTSPQEMIDATIADSVRFNTFAEISLVESRTARRLSELKTEVLQTYNVDSVAVFTYNSDRESLDDSSELASWTNGSISALEFDGISAFLALGRPLSTHSAEWIFHSLRNQARLTHIAEVFATEFPEEFNSFTPEADAFAVDQSSEMLFTANVIDVVHLSDSIVFEAYQQMVSIPQIPETRVFQSVMIPGGLLDSAIVLLGNDNALLEFGYPGYTEFLADGNEFLSRPVQHNELPTQMDLILFLLEASDTLWQRPVEVSEDLFVFYKLAEIIPPHSATFDQVETDIRRNLLIHLEEQRTMEWMCELEAAHQFQINLGILGKLPIDPAAWSEF